MRQNASKGKLKCFRVSSRSRDIMGVVDTILPASEKMYRERGTVHIPRLYRYVEAVIKNRYCQMMHVARNGFVRPMIEAAESYAI